ncbi:MAG: hypothetical protein NTW29_04975 [Bacteroidetes bacterium]|nr:hypothetical protein [Bacteroidota bacterium]
MKKLQLLALLAMVTTGALSQNVGIGTANPTARLHVGGNLKIDSVYTLEFGAGISGKEINAGKIGYQVFSPTGLDIVGAGTAQTNRRITFWAEGGSVFKGDIVGNTDLAVFNNATIGQDLTVNGTISAGLVYVYNDYTLTSGSLGLYTIACPSGTRLITGGGGHRDFNVAAADITVNYSGPDINAPLTNWRLIVTNDNGSASRSIRIYCNCARIN